MLDTKNVLEHLEERAILSLDELYGLDKNYLDRKLYKIESGKLVLDEEKLNKIRRTL
jgi:hypothetical protein